MTLDQFRIEYTATFKKFMSYPSHQVGSQVYAEKMADLADAYPDFAEIVENEQVS